jgi:peptidoglycan hydrolase-like protein with peptidoglycan-binding domain
MAQDLRESFISTVQSALAEGEHYRGTIDGDLGPVTLDAVRSFQEANELTVTGRLNPETMDALNIGYSHFSEIGDHVSS